jgi:hypothetical protein
MGRYSRQGATVLGAVTILSGFAVIALSWAGAAATLFIPTQVAYAVSGGLTGIALIGTGAAVLNAQISRVVTAERSHELDALIDGAVDALVGIERRRS